MRERYEYDAYGKVYVMSGTYGGRVTEVHSHMRHVSEKVVHRR